MSHSRKVTFGSRAPRAALAVAVALSLASCPSPKEGAASRPGGAAQPPSLPAPSLAIAGSGSNIPLTQKLLDAYGRKKGTSLRIPPSIGSAGAVKALQAGKLGLGLLSRPLKQGELASGLKQRRYARLGLVLGAHPSVPDTSIGAAELLRIYSGAKTAWSDGRTIVVLAREAGDSSNAALEKAIPGFKEALAEALARKRWEVYYTDAEENDAITTLSGSLGLTDTAALVDYGPAIKALRFEGARPTTAKVADGSYPLTKDLYFAFKEPLGGEVRAFMTFAASAEGRKIIAAGGGVPAGDD
jgi:phosphate transport system substrate-binding protein